jgi:hypothetical protein
MSQAMGAYATNFESETARNQYIDELVKEIEELEIKAKYAKAFRELYESANFKIVILDGLLKDYAADKARLLTDPNTTEELETETLIELKSLRYLSKFLQTKLNMSANADRLVAENKQLLLDVQSGKEDI